MRIASVVGTRPEFVQAEPVLRALRRARASVLVHTGQHYDRSMSETILEDLKLPRPSYHLGVGSGTHATQTGLIVKRLEPVLMREKPEAVLVYGDTNSTLAGALTAAKMNIPVAHVEAGMRSYNRAMPEELNRTVVDHLSTFLFCSSRTAVGNLEREGIRAGVELVGDVMYDSVLAWGPVVRARDVPKTLGLSKKGYMLMTLHRPSNVDDLRVLMKIIAAVGEIEATVLFPLHPRTRATLRAAVDPRATPANLRVLDPLGYLDFLSLLRGSAMVLTDSGGVQKQAYFFGVPCVTLRNETEWVETVEAGWNVVVGTDRRRILKAVRNFRPTGPRPRLFGSGHAADRIVRTLSTSRVTSRATRRRDGAS